MYPNSNMYASSELILINGCNYKGACGGKRVRIREGDVTTEARVTVRERFKDVTLQA